MGFNSGFKGLSRQGRKIFIKRLY